MYIACEHHAPRLNRNAFTQNGFTAMQVRCCSKETGALRNSTSIQPRPAAYAQLPFPAHNGNQHCASAVLNLLCTPMVLPLVCRVHHLSFHDQCSPPCQRSLTRLHFSGILQGVWQLQSLCRIKFATQHIARCIGDARGMCGYVRLPLRLTQIKRALPGL